MLTMQLGLLCQSNWFSQGKVMSGLSQQERSESTRSESAKLGQRKNQSQGEEAKVGVKREQTLDEDRKGYYQQLIGTEGYTHVNVSKVIALCRHEIAQDVMLEHFVRYMLFILLFCSCVILQRRPETAVGVSAALDNYIFGKPYSNKQLQLKAYADITSVEDWWDWHQSVLLDDFYVDTYYSGTEASLFDEQVVMQHLKFIDGLRLVQRRAKNGTCLVDNRAFR
jgi:hypothetical protein